MNTHAQPDYTTYDYQHADPSLTAELTFHAQSGLWILRYLREGERTSISIYQSRSVVTLILHSLGYHDAHSRPSSA